ncbi:ABC transporter ATP-binding protein [Pseudaestuariivita atlantica]|uniref:ABC transporter ATP-binding protein n=1 Tax=Pseudaestuariivita atlantica TaxID=1317121 RepID=A0A0L1JNV7_9RHOB|nr:ABC transporter ATP-binding protein [Pseudaestuariivita atlantica]KNG93098.1 ABC transporter ATP-binding protein [Pseudaestuariivita atlantica]
MTEPLVTFERVEKRFDDFVAVKGATLDIGAGEFVAIMGPSGCGKTTTLRMLAGLDAPTSGTIRIAGQVMNDVPAHERDTPMVWQSLALFPFLNARENVEFGLKMRGVGVSERRQRAMTWLDRMEIAEFAERNVETLSGGQRQRVALARALVTEPKLLLLDEPLSALDAHLVIRMQSVLSRLQRELGITFVYVTHSQSEAFAMADRVVIMSQGEIAQVGTPREVYRAPRSRFVAEFVGRNNILPGEVVASHQGMVSVQTPLGTFNVQGDAAPGTSASIVVAADMMQVGGGENRLTATVISEEFVGSMVTAFLEASDGTELKVQVQERALADLGLETGREVSLGWNTADGHLLVDETP